jgi:dephospho-CoA kinase
MLVIFVGKIGSGKTTAANILKKYSFEEETFAEPIKQFLLSIGFNYKDVYGSQDEKLKVNKFWNVSGREFMQKFATDIMRNQLKTVLPQIDLGDSTVWVRAMEKKILNNTSKNIVIGDGRFPDEIMLIKKYGGIVIKVDRPSNNNYDNSVHESESYFDTIIPDYEIINDGTFEDLENKIKNILNL